METTLKERREALKWWDSLNYNEKAWLLPRGQSMIDCPIDTIVKLYKLNKWEIN